MQASSSGRWTFTGTPRYPTRPAGWKAPACRPGQRGIASAVGSLPASPPIGVTHEQPGGKRRRRTIPAARGWSKAAGTPWPEEPRKQTRQRRRRSQAGRHFAGLQVLHLVGGLAVGGEEPVAAEVAEELIDEGVVLHRGAVEQDGTVGPARQAAVE